MPITISGDSPNLTSAGLASPVFSGTPTGTGVLTSGTAQASTSGTSIDFTGIPSWVKRITVLFNGVSTNGTSNFVIQIGDSGGFENTGYVSGSTYGFTSSSSVTSVNGYVLNYSGFGSPAPTIQGTLTINNVSANTWVSSHTASGSTGASVYGGGTKTLSDVLTQVRITVGNGADTFDAGSINILYE